MDKTKDKLCLRHHFAHEQRCTLKHSTQTLPRFIWRGPEIAQLLGADLKPSSIAACDRIYSTFISQHYTNDLGTTSLIDLFSLHFSPTTSPATPPRTHQGTSPPNSFQPLNPLKQPDDTPPPNSGFIAKKKKNCCCMGSLWVCRSQAVKLLSNEADPWGLCGGTAQGGRLGAEVGQRLTSLIFATFPEAPRG